MNITYQQLYNRCEAISAYEGGRITDASGNSLFSVVHITTQDETLLQEFSKQVAAIIRNALDADVNTVEFADDGITFTFYSNANTKEGETDKLIESVLTAYIMWQWLLNKDVNRATAWNGIYLNMLDALKKALLESATPSKSRASEEDVEKEEDGISVTYELSEDAEDDEIEVTYES